MARNDKEMPPLHARTNVGILEEQAGRKRGVKRLLAIAPYICLLLFLISTSCSGWKMWREHNIDMSLQPSKRVRTPTVCESSVQFKGADEAKNKKNQQHGDSLT